MGEATATLLQDMDKFGKVQTVSAVINQFYAADYDGSGHISGKEAELLFPQLKLLWDLVPSFDRSAVIAHVSAHGLTLAQFAAVVDALVADSPDACPWHLSACAAVMLRRHQPAVQEKQLTLHIPRHHPSVSALLKSLQAM